MKIAFALLLALTGCVDGTQATPDDCGPRPIRPVVSPTFTSTQVIMTHAEFAALIQYAKDAEVWGLCIEGDAK